MPVTVIRMDHGYTAVRSQPDPRLSPDAVQLVTRTAAHADVRIVLDDGLPAVIGSVRLRHESWAWEHSDGEQSSPTSATRAAAAHALAEYHRNHKPRRNGSSLRQML